MKEIDSAKQRALYSPRERPAQHVAEETIEGDLERSSAKADIEETNIAG